MKKDFDFWSYIEENKVFGLDSVVYKEKCEIISSLIPMLYELPFVNLLVLSEFVFYLISFSSNSDYSKRILNDIFSEVLQFEE